MRSIVVGTDAGVVRTGRSGAMTPDESSPPGVRFLARTHNGLAVVAGDGALWAQEHGSGWRLVNERPVPEDVWAFGSDPRLEGRLYIGVSPALLYISDDGGGSWTACDSIRKIPGYERWTFPPPPHIPHIRSIAPDPEAPGAVYIGVEEGGVYRSEDGGESWQSLNDGLYWDVHTIAPASGSLLYATTGDGFHRSEDGGNRWQQIMTGLDRSYTVPLLVDPKRSERLYTAAAATPPPGWGRGANAALYRSEDGGAHWTQLEHGLPSRFDVMVRAMALDDEGRVLAASAGSVYLSDDGGDSWRTLAEGLPAVQALAVS
jgi:photosystem II stability/assembly factor-like uncharacterized protein